METIAQEAKRLLEPIPEDKWITGLYGTYRKDGCRCFIGHWNEVNGGEPDHSDKEDDLYDAVENFLGGYSEVNDPFSVNDGDHPNYPQPTPKQRVMALLDDMILWEKSQEFANTMKLSKALNDDDTTND